MSYVAKHSKQRKTTKVIKLQRIASIWCQKHQTNAKLQKWSYYDEIASIWRRNIKTIQYAELRLKTFKTTLNCESGQIIMHCNDLTSKRSKKLSYVPKLQKWSNYNELHRFDVETIKTTQNYKRDQIMINLHRFDVKTIQNVELRRKTFKTTQNYKTDQIIMHYIDLTSKRSKLLS